MTASRAYILAGGRSSRFGSDKARAEFAGMPLIARIANVLRPLSGDVTVIADAADKYVDLDLRTIADRRANGGPLAGLETALHDAFEHRTSWIFLTSCDLLELKPAWFYRLQEWCLPSTEFVAFRGDRWEPLMACYQASLLPLVSERLLKGEGALWKLLEAAEGVGLPLPPDWPHRLQANTRAELAQAQSDWERHAQ